MKMVTVKSILLILKIVKTDEMYRLFVQEKVREFDVILMKMVGKDRFYTII